ncbi:hypothetical protein BTBSAS_200038 [Brochothrix thermosphacta]|uniref:Uncharacterized protein n=1 Tax=Brochothrix thermosphacta TaxID=2756 RepID=A0A2X0S920_BROTH|nr:hypothetical protein BTBSAS_200038 [Brochothrix thermosphacta]
MLFSIYNQSVKYTFTHHLPYNLYDFVTEITGLEPVTYALTVRCSTIELYLII